MYYPRKVSETQEKIMDIVTCWGKEKKKPIPIRIIIEKMEEIKTIESKTVRAVRSLVRKGFMRRAMDRSSRSSYVQLRSL